MKAIALRGSQPTGEPDAFEEVELPEPRIGSRDLLVRLRAISVNPVDYKMRRKRGPDAEEPLVLGWDAAGVVEKVGPEVELFEVGDEVFYAGDVTKLGCNAEVQAVDERIVAKKPAGLDFEKAAALPLTALTAWEAMFQRMGISEDGSEEGRSILIIGGAGGVGSVAIQLARKIGKLRVIATASRAETEAWCREMGADDILNHHQPLAPQIEKLGLGGVDFIFCTQDTSSYWETMAEIINPLGVLGLIVDAGAALDINLLKAKSVRVAWELMFSRAMFSTPDMVEQHRILEKVAALVDDGTLVTTHRETLGMLSAASLAEAHRRLESGKTIGKLVLTVG